MKRKKKEAVAHKSGFAKHSSKRKINRSKKLFVNNV